jgi:hypothetical protein
MSNAIQAHNLYTLLASAGSDGVRSTEVATHLGVLESSVPVYIFSLKKRFNAKIENIKNGRKVIGYKLLNPDDIEVPTYRRNSIVNVVKPIKATKTKVSKPIASQKSVSFDNADVPTLDEDLDIGFSDSEFNDIKAMLGL